MFFKGVSLVSYSRVLVFYYFLLLGLRFKGNSREEMKLF